MEQTEHSSVGRDSRLGAHPPGLEPGRARLLDLQWGWEQWRAPLVKKKLYYAFVDNDKRIIRPFVDNDKRIIRPIISEDFFSLCTLAFFWRNWKKAPYPLNSGTKTSKSRRSLKKTEMNVWNVKCSSYLHIKSWTSQLPKIKIRLAQACEFAKLDTSMYTGRISVQYH